MGAEQTNQFPISQEAETPSRKRKTTPVTRALHRLYRDVLYSQQAANESTDLAGQYVYEGLEKDAKLSPLEEIINAGIIDGVTKAARRAMQAAQKGRLGPDDPPSITLEPELLGGIRLKFTVSLVVPESKDN